MTTVKSARTSHSLLAITMVAALVALTGCDKKADQAACQKMVDHDYGILDQSTHMSESPEGRKLADELKKKSLDACVASDTMSVVECHMNSKTTAEMSACDEKAK